MTTPLVLSASALVLVGDDAALVAAVFDKFEWYERQLNAGGALGPRSRVIRDAARAVSRGHSNTPSRETSGRGEHSDLYEALGLEPSTTDDLTAVEAAELLGYTDTHVRRLARKGAFGSVDKRGGCLRIPRTGLIEFQIRKDSPWQ